MFGKVVATCAWSSSILKCSRPSASSSCARHSCPAICAHAAAQFLGRRRSSTLRGWARARLLGRRPCPRGSLVPHGPWVHEIDTIHAVHPMNSRCQPRRTFPHPFHDELTLAQTITFFHGFEKKPSWLHVRVAAALKNFTGAGSSGPGATPATHNKKKTCCDETRC